MKEGRQKDILSNIKLLQNAIELNDLTTTVELLFGFFAGA